MLRRYGTRVARGVGLLHVYLRGDLSWFPLYQFLIIADAQTDEGSIYNKKSKYVVLKASSADASQVVADKVR